MMTNHTRKTPKVSIGIPVYNGEKYLELALDSLIKQSFLDLEIIISDNASTDRTEEICRSYQAQDSRIVYHRNNTNIGAAGNYKKVFQLAQGEYFKWMAHDDRCSLNYIEECVRVLDQEPEVVSTFPRFELIDDCDRTYPQTAEHTYVTPELNITTNIPRNFMSPSHSERYADVLFKTTECYEFFGLARREIIERTSQHDAYYGSDKVLLCELAMMGQLKEVLNATGYFRIHGEQSQSLKSHKERSQWISPNLSYGVFFSRVKCLQGYYRSVIAYPAPIAERIKCFWILTSWSINLNNWRGMLGDIFSFRPKIQSTVNS